MKIKLFVAGITLQIAAVSTQATELRDFVSEVVQSHPQILQRVHSYRQMVQDEKIAAAGWRPTLDLVASGGRYTTNSPITGLRDRDYDGHEASLILTQNLYNGWDTSNAVKQARSRMSSERERIVDDADNLALESIGLYLDALTQLELAELAKRNVDAHEYVIRKLKERSSSGLDRQSNEEQALTRLALARAGLVAQQNNLQDALTKLHYMLGRYVMPEQLVRPDALPVPAGSLDSLLDQAIRYHPAMKSAYLNIEAAEFDYDRSKSAFHPKLDLKLQKRVGDNVGSFDGPTDEHSATLELSYNLYNGGADRAALRQKLSRAYEHKDFSNKVRRQIIQSLRLSWTAYQTLDKQINYLAAHAAASKNTLQLYREEFNVGRRDLLDLLDAESEHNGAMISYVEAGYDRLEATYRIQEGLGNLFASIGLAVVQTDKNFQLATLDVNERDAFPFDEDVDQDTAELRFDHCQNSALGYSVNTYGCRNSLQPTLEYEHVAESVQQWVEQLNFVYDSDELTEPSLQRLGEIISQLKTRVKHFHVLEVHAHTDGIASDKYNLRLSKARALAIKQELVDAGLSENAIRTYGHGKRLPLVANDTEENRAKNRRVEFVLKHVYAE